MSHQGTCPIRLLLRPRALHAITRESKGCSYKGWKHPALLTCCCTGTPSYQQVIRIKQLGWITSSPISLAPWHGSKERLIVASPSLRPQLVVCRQVGCLGSRLPALPPSSKVLRRREIFRGKQNARETSRLGFPCSFCSALWQWPGRRGGHSLTPAHRRSPALY